MKECSPKQAWEKCLSFSFAADRLTFHPQTAEDCGWKASIKRFYEVRMCMHSVNHYSQELVLFLSVNDNSISYR